MERLIKYFVPEKYELNITIDKESKKIGGEVVVTGEAKQEDIKFHAVDLKIRDVLVNGKKCEFKADGKILEVFNVPLGNVELNIDYDGSLNENMEGAYLSSYEYKGKTELIVATQFESHYARETFPCIDEPEAKAIFELTITAPDEDTVLSNMPEVKSEKESSYKTVHFQPTPRMSTYLLAWVVGKLHGKTITNKHGVKISTYAPLNQEIDSVDFANEVAARALE